MLTTIINIFFGRCPECLEPQMLMISAEPLSCLGAWVWKEWPHYAIGSRWWNTNMVDFYIIHYIHHNTIMAIWQIMVNDSLFGIKASYLNVFSPFWSQKSRKFENANSLNPAPYRPWFLCKFPTSVTQWYLWNISVYNLSLNHGHPWTMLLLIHTFGGAGRASTLWPPSMCPVQRFHRCLAWNLVAL